MKLEAKHRLTQTEVLASDWFDSKTPEQKKEYIKTHPHSKYAKESSGEKKVKKSPSKPAARGPDELRPLQKDLDDREHHLMEQMRRAGSKAEMAPIVKKLEDVRNEKVKLQHEGIRQSDAKDATPKAALRNELKDLNTKLKGMWAPVRLLDKQMAKRSISSDERRALTEKRRAMTDTIRPFTHKKFELERKLRSGN